MSQKSTEFADSIKELSIQKEQLEDWKYVIDSYPTIASELAYVLIFHKDLADLKTELQAIIDAPNGSRTDPFRNIQLINVDLPRTKAVLEDSKNSVIKAFLDCDLELENLDFLFLEYLRYDEDSENDINSFDANIALSENIARLEEEISILTALAKKSKRKWYQFWK